MRFPGHNSSPTGRLARLAGVSAAVVGTLLVSFVLASSASGWGLSQFSQAATNRDGSPDTQAGSHPYAFTTTFALTEPKTIVNSQFPNGRFVVEQGLKDATEELPAGFVGDPTAVPQCPFADFASLGKCPAGTAVGLAEFYFTNSAGPQSGPVSLENQGIQSAAAAVYNLEPPAGVAAEFGFRGDGLVPVVIDASVRTGGDYGITVHVHDISQAIGVYATKVTLWGVPADPSHNALRGSCVSNVGGEHVNLAGLRPGEAEQEINEPDVQSGGDCAVDLPVVPFLTNPTSCGVSRTASFSVDSWQEQGKFSTLSSEMPEITGCERLDFSPSIGVVPDGLAGSTPTGLNVDVRLPQESTLNPAGLGEADMKNTTVALPAGVQISPAAADGLQACSPAQIGFLGINPTSGEQEYTPGRASCPDASKIATARIKTPLLEEEVTGSVYLAAPQNFSLASGSPLENPFGSLITFYLVAEAPERGVLVKLAGKVTLTETGQIVTTVENIPQFPVSDAKFEFYGTARAPLATPGLCGTYQTETSFAPWSGTSAVHPPASFQITSGPNGSPCSDPLPFSPSLTSGTTNINAGSFTPLTTTLSREDGQQSIQNVVLHYPPGVSGMLTGVPLCPEAQANAGTCSEASLIGETIVSVGLGNDPFTVTGGKVYLTEKYEGAPFGLSIVNPAKAGPFVLQEGRPVVVRAKIDVDQTTAALTVTTDPTGPHAIPSVIEGIPLQIKHVNVLVNRPGFTFNPTNCNPMSITGTLTSNEGATGPLSMPFQVSNCGILKFQPQLTVTTGAKASRPNGVALTFKIAYPKNSVGSQSWFQEAKFDLPKQLPARLTTIQQACLADTFEHNRGACPAHSIIGHAVVHTPVLPVPLEGSVYFVSYGGAKFPDAVIVLDGYGVHIELHGNTFINGKTGVTSATFANTPDVPFESIEVTLPTGPFSEFGANLPSSAKNSFCGQKLIMPTRFRAQNGGLITQNTPVNVTGCPKAHKAKKPKKKHHKAKKRKTSHK